MLAGQPWYGVTMAPNDEVVTLQNFDGFTAYSWLSPMLLVCLAAVAVAALMTRYGAQITLSLGFLNAALITLLSANAISNQDLGGVSKQIESATGIAATHGIDGLQIQTLQSAYLSLFVFSLIALGFIYAVIVAPRWPIRPSSRTRTSGSVKKSKLDRERAKLNTSTSELATKDSISIWDEQR